MQETTHKFGGRWHIALMDTACWQCYFAETAAGSSWYLPKPS